MTVSWKTKLVNWCISIVCLALNLCTCNMWMILIAIIVVHIHTYYVLVITPDDMDDDRVEYMYALHNYSLQKLVVCTNQNSIA